MTDQPATPRETLMRAARLFAQLVLTGVFATSGILKLADMEQTQNAIEGYRLLPGWVIWPAALFLPWTELVTAACLWVPWLRSASQKMLAALLLLFLCAIVAAWARGLDIRCGCFGSTEKANYPWLVARDLGLIGLLILTKKKNEN